MLQGLTLSVLSLQEAWGYVLMVIKKLTFSIWWGVFTSVKQMCAIPEVCIKYYYLSTFSSVQLLSHVRLFVTPWTAARQASLSITNSWSLPKLMSIESVMPSNHLLPCRPLLLLPSVFPYIRVFSNGSALLIRWPKYWSFSFSISPSNEHPWLISFRMDCLDSQESSPIPLQKHQFFCTQLSL